MIYCNECNKPVRYIDSRKAGIVKCEGKPCIAYTVTGRELEVYLKHECRNRDQGHNEISETSTVKKKLRTSFIKDPRRED